MTLYALLIVCTAAAVKNVVEAAKNIFKSAFGEQMPYNHPHVCY